jgi:hypothetical protein
MQLDYGARFDPMAVFEAIRGDETKKKEASTATLSFLIKLGAQIEDVVTWRKGTPLIRYTSWQDGACVVVAREWGRPPRAEEYELTVIEYARKQGKADICELLEVAM